MRPLLVALIAASMIWPAAAQTVCGERALIVGELARLYGELPVGIGLDRGGNAIEVLVSQARTWTLIRTRPEGRTCVVRSGHAWQAIERHLDADRFESYMY